MKKNIVEDFTIKKISESYVLILNTTGFWPRFFISHLGALRPSWEQPHPIGSYSEYFLTQKQQTSS